MYINYKTKTPGFQLEKKIVIKLYSSFMKNEMKLAYWRQTVQYILR